MTRTFLKKPGIVDKHALILYSALKRCIKITQMHCHGFGLKKKHGIKCCFTSNSKTFKFIIEDILVLKWTSWSYLINMILFTTETRYHTVRHNPCGCSWTKAVVTPCQSFDCQAVEVKGEGEGTAFHLAETKVPFVTMRQTHIVMDLECYLLCGETALKICCCCFISLHSSSSPNNSVIGSDSFRTMFSGDTAHL